MIATVAAAGLVLAAPSDLASGTVLIPYGTPFRSKSPDEVNGPPSPITFLLPPQTQTGGGGGRVPPGGAPPVAPAGEPCSFTPTTQVTTNHGREPIGKVQVGEKVLAYNPKTHKMELEPVMHVWINHDNDLIDLTLTTIPVVRHGRTAMRTSETIHTNRKHPFLTEEKGFLPVGQIKIGMHVLRSDGTYGIVTDWKVVPGTKVMYNLEVAQDHTFTVGTGQWVVHNCGVGDSPNLGRGTVFSHFTDASGVRGITGVDPASLELGQTVSVNELHFGQGANSFMATESGDIFVTELGADATARQLAQIGVFGEKQAFVIQFSQEAAVMNDAIPTATNAARSIFTIPGDSVLQDFGFLVTRLR